MRRLKPLDRPGGPERGGVTILTHYSHQSVCIISPRVHCRWTTSLSTRIHHSGHDHSTIDYTGKKHSFWTLLVVCAACLAPHALPT